VSPCPQPLVAAKGKGTIVDDVACELTQDRVTSHKAHVYVLFAGIGLPYDPKIAGTAINRTFPGLSGWLAMLGR